MRVQVVLSFLGESKEVWSRVPPVLSNRVVQMGYYAIFLDFPKTSGRMGTRGYHNLAQRDQKPQKWTFQNHSFSKHSKFLESIKYKYIFGSTEVEEKMFFPEIPTHICVLRHTRRIPGPYCQIRVQIAKKKCQHFCVFFNLLKHILSITYLT